MYNVKTKNEVFYMMHFYLRNDEMYKIGVSIIFLSTPTSLDSEFKLLRSFPILYIKSFSLNKFCLLLTNFMSLMFCFFLMLKRGLAFFESTKIKIELLCKYKTMYQINY